MTSKQRVFGKKDLPEVVSMEALAYFSDEELQARKDTLRSEIERRQNANRDATAWEIEWCYVAREESIRQERIVRHRSYEAEQQAFFSALYDAS